MESISCFYRLRFYQNRFDLLLLVDDSYPAVSRAVSTPYSEKGTVNACMYTSLVFVWFSRKIRCLPNAGIQSIYWCCMGILNSNIDVLSFQVGLLFNING